MKRSFSFMTVMMAGTILTGCTMIPDYTRPDFSAAQSWPDMPVALSAPAQQAVRDINWQEFFKSPALQIVIETALNNNRDLRLAALNIAEARALYRIGRADLVPGIDANAGATIQNLPDDAAVTGQEGRSEIYQANLGITAYELDLFGRIRSLNESALQSYLASAEARDAVRNSLIAETANAYLQLLADRKLLKLTEDTLAAQQKSYDLIRQSSESGVATDLDLARATTAVEAARVNLEQYKRLVAQDRNALVLLMGVKDDEAFIPRTSLDDIDLYDALPVGLPSEVLLLRPDIRQAEHLLLARNADIGAARAAFFPAISLTGAYGFASDSLSSLFSSGAAGAWSFVPQLTLPIFQGGRNAANLDLAEIRKDAAIAEYERAIQVAFREVADELAARDTLTTQLEAQTRLVNAAQKAYNISNARYKTGIDSFLSVLDAQRELYTAQQNRIIIEKQRLSNLVDLYKAVGGGSSGNE